MADKKSTNHVGTSFSRGIRKVSSGFLNILRSENRLILWRGIWLTIAFCVFVLTSIIAYNWWRKEIKVDYTSTWRTKQPVGPSLIFVKPDEYDRKGWLQNKNTGEILAKEIDWISLSPDYDSLAVFSSKGKRGYFNRFDGKITIPAKYKKAWVFSEGRAAVLENDSIFFIDHKGVPVNKRKFYYHPITNDYVYHGNLCIVANEEGKLGLIDMEGNTVLSPQYSFISSEKNNFWRAMKSEGEDSGWYAINSDGKPVFDLPYRNIEISEAGIICTMDNHQQVFYNFLGEQGEEFLCQSIEPLLYSDDEEGVKSAQLLRYRMSDGYEGLCDKNGKVITEPIFWIIKAVNENLYLCHYKDVDAGVLINSEGEIINNELI